MAVLARYGGLRTPSETFALTWQHINWESNRITVPSPKTEHHEGHASRVILIFPELRPYLEAAFHDPKAEGQAHLITRYRSTKQNLRTQFERIIQRSGLKPWPKLFQNLRSSRETELAEKFPIQVVTILDRQLRSGCQEALPTGDRRPLRPGKLGTMHRAAKSAAVSDRSRSTGLASGNRCCQFFQWIRSSTSLY